MIVRLADKLDVTTLALREKTKQCEQLAAENAALKDLAKGWANATDDRLFEEHGEIFHDSIDDCEAQLKTICPATDAFLREVRAQGIDAASAELNQLAERSEKEAPIAAEHHRSAALYLQLLAAELRQCGARFLTNSAPR
ncbi:hypothetical protein [Cronobacter sakazakii]|uniref:hypothetical protein n=1 Tax=Cronobacter sakazakii TaxID=28141 RepID=UPI000BE79733|nr:hypothetical protein [Cronobacter sakazakii]AXW97340.2 hypothetical protein CsakCS931_24650 [Cronobacter sakazakii]ELY4526445.1 hypothetical protein [Cronobacter sakazakii]MDK1066035.1 hypothetical protein [Cronobacter sakazakii]PQX72466.1 hypothetical protein C5975_18670 [Cronobacter sakazakii]PQY60571.1 hypothetical protein C5954_03560 [Cronobacter sakazakii]